MRRWVHPADRPRNKKLFISESQRQRVRRTASRRRRQLIAVFVGGLLLFIAVAYLKPHLVSEVFGALADLLTKGE